MPIFQCQKCGCAESTTYGAYHAHGAKLCSECSMGKWHNHFPKKSAIGMLVDGEGYLHPAEKLNVLPLYVEIIGKIH